MMQFPRAIGVIGGTGLTDFARLSDVEHIHVQTEYGEPSAPLFVGYLGEQAIVFLARHGRPHKVAPHLINYRANIAALDALGVKQVIAINAVGGISPRMTTGSIVIPDQVIDYTYGRDHTFFDLHLKHVDFTHPFDAELSQRLFAAAESVGVPCINGGAVAVTQGPRLETAAEISRLEKDGCDIVGMTTMPEAILAREKSLRYASLALVVNPAAGKSTEEVNMETISSVLATGMVSVRQVIEYFVNT